ncbi:uncharacterized protein EV420DRAFT_1622639 [Desarmillaria tabescens]|uniref:Uncharacterized protein n=1 Tax=Armillaria tabescens TaxID=1929756 RepID=A0AA39JM26_ARMTA|nr:uncharacterized protein EV420DRAFT_1622639 [Desarmillaria tabescens]KAK0445270.1 hypothetical protein EV420DRAFT_1622639 [Desarmillaria tabescens]
MPAFEQVERKPVPTFLVAKHKTTSTATIWDLFALTQSPDTQIKLQDELLQVDTNTPMMDELNALSYLDWDDVIPLSWLFIDRKGKVQDCIRCVSYFIHIDNHYLSEALWGEDARAFKIPDTVKSIPGVWGNLLSFIGSPHLCIGYCFSLVEYVLCVLVFHTHF